MAAPRRGIAEPFSAMAPTTNGRGSTNEGALVHFADYNHSWLKIIVSMMSLTGDGAGNSIRPAGIGTVKLLRRHAKWESSSLEQNTKGKTSGVCYISASAGFHRNLFSTRVKVVADTRHARHRGGEACFVAFAGRVNRNASMRALLRQADRCVLYSPTAALLSAAWRRNRRW